MSNALLEKGKAHEFEMDVRAAVECYEVRAAGILLAVIQSGITFRARIWR